jgi:tetratricopeptide (TPR) repeat protein
MLSDMPNRSVTAGRADPRVAGRLRELRTARGLSQAELAGDDFTKAFISQLETGRTKLSPRAARAFSGRLGVSVEELIGTEIPDKDAQLALLEAERELASGGPEMALKLARAVRGPGRLFGRSLRLQGRALLALDRPREAIDVLERALEAFRVEQQRDFYIRTLLDLAHAHARLNRTQQALVLALECERALRSGELVDQAFALKVESYLAQLYADSGQSETAEAHTERALELAKNVVNHEALAALYARLARAEQDHASLDKAIEYWQKSLRELDYLGRDRSIADSWHNIATAYLRLGQIPKAKDALDRAERLMERAKHDRLRAWIRLTRAKIALRASRLAEAETLAGEASRDESASGLARSEAMLVRAQILDRRRAPLDQVRQSFEAALSALADEPPAIRVRALRLYSDVLAARGETKAALAKSREALDLVRPQP